MDPSQESTTTNVSQTQHPQEESSQDSDWEELTSQLPIELKNAISSKLKERQNQYPKKATQPVKPAALSLPSSTPPPTHEKHRDLEQQVERKKNQYLAKKEEAQQAVDRLMSVWQTLCSKREELAKIQRDQRAAAQGVMLDVMQIAHASGDANLVEQLTGICQDLEIPVEELKVPDTLQARFDEEKQKNQEVGRKKLKDCLSAAAAKASAKARSRDHTATLPPQRIQGQEVVSEGPVVDSSTEDEPVDLEEEDPPQWVADEDWKDKSEWDDEGTVH
ncbi:MAG: hypothetical protein Q9169_001338 [Polycauliona sp. 2 TL-2023]